MLINFKLMGKIDLKRAYFGRSRLPAGAIRSYGCLALGTGRYPLLSLTQLSEPGLNGLMDSHDF